MLIPHLMPVFMVFCFALGIWVRLPILVAAGLASLVFFLLGVEWNLPVAPDWIHLWGATLLNDAFQAFCLILLMVLLLDRIGWTIEWVDAIDGFLGPVGLFAIAALLWLTAVGLSFYGPAATSPPAAIYFGCVFLAAMFLGPYALRVAVQSVAAPKRFTAMLAS